MRYLITIMVLLAVSQSAHGAVLDSCDQWASYCSGGYCVYNAVWGPTGNWSQCITAQSCTQWTVVATHPGNGVKSYPNSSLESINGTTIGQLSSCSSSVSTSSGSSGDFCLAYDIWAPIEIMIWLKWVGAVGVWGSYVTTATIGGRTYDVYKDGYPGFMVQSQMSGGTFDIKSILDYCVSQGWCSTGGNVEKVQCGFELTGCSNATFSMNSYSVSYSTGGGTTSTTTTAATTSTTSATTSTTTTSGGGCDCGTCDWYGTDVPICCESCSGWGWYDGGCRRSCVCPSSCEGGCVGSQCGATTTTAATTTTTAATTTTTAATTSTTTTSATTSTTTTSGGGDCDCGTCSWWGTPIPMCCTDDCGSNGWGWQDGGCNRSCVCEDSCPNN